jgi:hypothetical protein
MTPEQSEQARALLDTVPVLDYEIRVQYPEGTATWGGNASQTELRAASVILNGVSGYPADLLDGIELELRKALDQVAVSRRGEIPPPTFHLDVEEL